MNDVLGALVLLPLGGAVVATLIPRRGAWVGIATALVLLTLTLTTAVEVHRSGPLHLELAGWGAPLGIDLRADGLSAAMLAMTAVVGLATTVYASGSDTTIGRPHFWPLWLALWSGLNAVYVSGDLFNTYVALELVGLAAVALVALGGRDALEPALRYLFVAVLGSLAYLLGVALVYAEAGTLDIVEAGRLDGGTTAVTALAVMALGLSLKTALFPLHAWLPEAHTAAPSAVSPLLSALVVKASLFVLIRVWFVVFGDVSTTAAAQLLGGLGTVAVVWGGVLALRQSRLKPIVAYSTVAQVGYLFLIFPLAGPGIGAAATSATWHAAAAGWTGALGLALAHGLAKAAMFMAAGTLALAHGGDRLVDLRGAATRMPMSTLTFALAGVSLAGLPPTFGFVGKWQLLQSGLASGQWWWLPVLLLGGLLTAAYTVRVLGATTGPPDGGEDLRPLTPVPRRMELAALSLAALAVALGVSSSGLLALLTVGSPLGGGS
ncbi:complex I subunit 5 family protein [Nocardioides sp.]|uniref:complex I subunit 5 family protein n=1 Tax=Nocardioides sp. TaxID=35761 RepID=UPI002737029D|nr:proton-conducting transporter membrane subunit [Nocardioides sp.]MDP3894201.1 proton-conducting transporter membrane subunit [Nocardioides sp.]